MQITKGQKWYKTINYEVYEYIVRQADISTVILLDVKTLKEIEVARGTFISTYSISKAMLLRELYMSLHDVLQEIEKELIEKDLQEILNRYKGYNND